MSNKRNNWVPEIMYEESAEGVASNFPFIQVPKDETMPSLLYIFTIVTGKHKVKCQL